ncbi:MAG: hypothetical protein LBM59_00525 [Ruminococcus sp.]|jgi:ABC-type glycerol-3-phosphate transport system substrate-binding protein|nr:hypothetical protein [Ruminococcus sp.]
MLKRLISALLVLSLLTITAVPAAISAETETEAITTQPGGYDYDEYMFEDLEEYPDFLFGTGDYLYAVAYDRPSSAEVYRYTIYAFDREAKFKWKMSLPYDKNERYLEFSSDIDGKITLTVFVPYENTLSDLKRLVGDRITYSLADGKLTATKTEGNFVYTVNNNNTKEYKIIRQNDALYNAGKTDIKSVTINGGSLFGTFRNGSYELLANKEVIETDLAKEKNYEDQFVDLQCGDFAITDRYDIKIFRKTEQKHPDLKQIFVGYTGKAKDIYLKYISAFNAKNSDYVAMTRFVNRPLEEMPASVDILITWKFDPYYKTSEKSGELLDLYEFMGKGYFNKDKILVNLLKANEKNGKLYSFSPEWEFEIMTANADIVKANGFSSFEAMLNLENELTGNKRVFSDKTRNSVFNNLSNIYITDFYDIETETADIKTAELENIIKFAKLYPTVDEYSVSEDYDKREFAIFGGYYEGGDSPPYNITQFDVGDYRSGRYAASLFTGITLPFDMNYDEEYSYNIFRNFSSYVNILYDGNYVLPGFFGKGTVKGTPASFDTIAVAKRSKNTDGASAFVDFYLTEYEPDYNYSLSAEVLARQAEEAIGQSRTHKRGEETVRDTVYFSTNDYFEIPDVTKDEAMYLLNSIKYGSFPAQRTPNNYYDYYYSPIALGNYDTIDEILDGKISISELEKSSEAALTERLKKLAATDTYY